MYLQIVQIVNNPTLPKFHYMIHPCVTMSAQPPWITEIRKIKLVIVDKYSNIGLVTIKLFICLSVRPSVGQTCGLLQHERNLRPHSSHTTRKVTYPSFLRRRIEWLVGATTPSA